MVESIVAVKADVGTPAPTNVSMANRAHGVSRRAASGAVWVLLALLAGRMLGLVTNLFLARLLSPDDFGLVSFAMILIGAFTVLQDLGVPASIVYSKKDINLIGATALTINIVAATSLFGVALIAAPYLARISGENGVAPVVVVLAFGLIISSLGSVQLALLDKHLAFRRKLVPEIVPLIAAGVTSIVLAIAGFGAWSLVGGYLVKSSLSSILLWSLSSVRPLPGFQWPIARDLMHYGKHVSLTAIVGFIGINADYFIVGHKLGTYDLGLYVLAFTIANIPCAIIGQVVTTVLFPAYTVIQDDHDALTQLFEDVFTVVSVLAVPAAIVIWVAGPTYVPLVFGDKWSEISKPLQMLAIYGVLRTIGMGFAPVYKAIGRPEVNWRLNLVRIFILIPMMLYMIRYGTVGIGIAYVAVAVVFIPMNAQRMGRFLHRRRNWFFNLALPHLAAVAVAVAVVAGWSVLNSGPALRSDYIDKAILSAITIVAYLLTLGILSARARHVAHESIQFASSRLGSLTRPSPGRSQETSR